MGVGVSAYLRKYPSMSCTSERHIPQALTLTSISSGWISGTGMSSRIGALPYSCMRAAFISPFLSKWWVKDSCHRTTVPNDQVQCETPLQPQCVFFNGVVTYCDRT